MSNYSPKFRKDFEELINKEKFKKLVRTYSTYEPYHFTKISETDHSQFIAWILNPREGHGAGSFFFDKFVEAIQAYDNVTESKMPPPASKFLFETELSFGKTEEYKAGSIDIFMSAPKEHYTYIVENKITAAESGQQLKKYYDFSEDRLSHGTTVLVLVDMSDSGEAKLEKARKKCCDSIGNWVVLSYDWLGNAIREYIDGYPSCISENIRLILEGYLYEIEGWLGETESRFYSESYKEVQDLGGETYRLWESEDFCQFRNVGLLDLVTDNDKCEDELLSQMFKYRHLISDIANFGFLQMIEGGLDEEYAVDAKTVHLHYTDIRVNMDENFKVPEGSNWPIYLSILRDKNNEEVGRDEVTYSFKLVRPNSKDQSYGKLKKYFSDCDIHEITKLDQKIRKYENTPASKLLSRSKQIGELFKIAISSYIDNDG